MSEKKIAAIRAEVVSALVSEAARVAVSVAWDRYLQARDAAWAVNDLAVKTALGASEAAHRETPTGVS